MEFRKIFESLASCSLYILPQAHRLAGWVAETTWGRSSAYKQEHLQTTEKLNWIDYFHTGSSKADDVQFLINWGLTPDNLHFFSIENAPFPPSLSWPT